MRVDGGRDPVQEHRRDDQPAEQADGQRGARGRGQVARLTGRHGARRTARLPSHQRRDQKGRHARDVARAHAPSPAPLAHPRQEQRHQRRHRQEQDARAARAATNQIPGGQHAQNQEGREREQPVAD